MLTDQFPAFIKEIFGEGGIVASIPKGRFVAEQQQYAEAIATSLVNDTPKQISLYQASGGMGKTLAYLVTAGLYWAIFGKKVIVGTSTIALREDICLKEKDKLEQIFQAINSSDLLNRYGINAVSLPIIRSRKGMGSYVSFKWLKEEMKNPRPGIQPFLDTYANQPSTYDFSVWFEDNDSLPCGLSKEDICLKQSESGLAWKEFKENREKSKDADILLTTHALLIINAVSFGKPLGDGFDAIIIDESEHLIDAVESREVKVSLTSLKNDFKGDATISKTITNIITHLKKVCGNKTITFNTDNHTAKLADDLVPHVEALVDALKTSKEECIFETNDAVKLLDALTHHRGFLQETNYVNANFDKHGNCFLFTKERKPLKPLYVLYGTPGVKNIILTSAFLNPPGATDFKRFSSQFGIKEEKVFCKKIFSVKNYGTCEWVFSEPDASDLYTINQNGDIYLKEEHIIHCADMGYAAQQTGKSLMLCTSYSDVERIAAELSKRGANVYRQGRGAKPTSFQHLFDGRENFILLLTAWEGINYLNIDHLLISKIPYFAPDNDKRNMEDNVNRGRSYDYLIDDTKRKTGQGFARAIRHPAHKATIWICDPRFPLPTKLADKNCKIRLEDKNGIFNCIPERFVKAADNGRIFMGN